MENKIALPTRMINYFKASYAEMKKVVWPTRKQATEHTIMVVVFSIAVAIFLWLLDTLFSGIITKIILK